MADNNGMWLPDFEDGKVKRHHVKDADGHAIKIGQKLYRVIDGSEVTVAGINYPCGFENSEGDRFYAGYFTSFRPVLDADGVPCEVWQDVYNVRDGQKLHISVVDHQKNRIASATGFAIGIWENPEDYTHTKPVIAADGKPLKVGQTMWGVNDGKQFEVVGINDGLALLKFGETGYTATEPENLTHQRPMLDAEGVPIHKGEVVWVAKNGKECRAVSVDYNSVVVDVLRESDGSWYTTTVAPDKLTHTKPEPPDSWELLEMEAASYGAAAYCDKHPDAKEIQTDLTMWDRKAIHLVRRCRALAERGRVMGDRSYMLQGVGKEEITEELKPCPFCGGEPVAVETHPGAGFIQCKRCGCAMDEYEAGDPCTLTEHWNRRTERTCRMEPTKDGGEWRCSECGYLQKEAYRGDKGWCLPRYCQVCGARVVRDDDL